MNNSSLPPNQTPAHSTPIVRVQIPDITVDASVKNFESTKALEEQNTKRIDSLQQALTSPPLAALKTDLAASHTVSPASPDDLRNLQDQSAGLAPKKIDRLIDSILQKFPLSQPVTIVFVGSKTDAETDKTATDVATRLTDRRVGKVLLVDSNPNSQTISSDLSLGDSPGIGNVICDDQPWQNLIQTGPTTGLDFLPYGNVNTAKTRRSQTADFLKNTKQVYQFTCVSAGLNDSPIAKSFCSSADGIYLLINLNQTSHNEAKAVADKFKLSNQPLVGCIALDAEQESK